MGNGSGEWRVASGERRRVTARADGCRGRSPVAKASPFALRATGDETADETVDTEVGGQGGA